MGTSISFGDKLITLAGVYSRITSGINNQEQGFSYGNVLVIDNDVTSKYGGGAGVSGGLDSGEDSVYEFTRLADFRDFVGGGKFYEMAKPLFKPFGQKAGVSKLFYVRALTTVGASVTLTGTNGEVVIQSRHEGLVGNGVLDSAKLVQGFSATLSAGVVDSAKYVLKLHRGTYAGVDANGQLINGLPKADSNPIIVAQTPEVADFQEIIDWMSVNEDFKNNFSLTSSTAGAIVVADLTAFSSNQLFAGGTQTNTDTTLIDQILDSIGKVDYSHILAPDSGASAASASNLKILSHITDEAKYDKIMVVAGGNKKVDLATSIASAKTFDSQRVVIVHGGVFEKDPAGGSSLVEKDAMQKAAYVLGRISGLPPYTPITFKGFDYAGEVHKITDRERGTATDSGVLTTFFNSELSAYICTQGINTLQANSNLVNTNGTSHVWQLVRIAYQLNKELIIEATRDLLGNQDQGPNRNTLSEPILKEWTKGFLQRRTATDTIDNLILSFKDVTTFRKGDAVGVNYGFVGNGEVNKLLFNGILLD